MARHEARIADLAPQAASGSGKGLICGVVPVLLLDRCDPIKPGQQDRKGLLRVRTWCKQTLDLSDARVSRGQSRDRIARSRRHALDG